MKVSSSLLVGLSVAAVVALVGSGGAAYYYYSQYQTTQRLLNNPTEASKREIKEVTDKLGKLMELPKGEEPTVATVLEKEKLKDQPFFARAANGDKVVIYAKALKAILFRPSTNKVIEVAPVSIGQPDGKMEGTDAGTSASSSAKITTTPKHTPTETPEAKPKE